MESAEVSRRSGHWSEELEVLGNGVESAIDLGEWGTAREMLARLGELRRFEVRNSLGRTVAEYATGDLYQALETLNALPSGHVFWVTLVGSQAQATHRWQNR